MAKTVYQGVSERTDDWFRFCWRRRRGGNHGVRFGDIKDLIPVRGQEQIHAGIQQLDLTGTRAAQETRGLGPFLFRMRGSRPPTSAESTTGWPKIGAQRSVPFLHPVLSDTAIVDERKPASWGSVRDRAQDGQLDDDRQAGSRSVGIVRSRFGKFQEGLFQGWQFVGEEVRDGFIVFRVTAFQQNEDRRVSPNESVGDSPTRRGIEQRVYHFLSQRTALGQAQFASAGQETVRGARADLRPCRALPTACDGALRLRLRDRPPSRQCSRAAGVLRCAEEGLFPPHQAGHDDRPGFRRETAPIAQARSEKRGCYRRE